MNTIDRRLNPMLSGIALALALATPLASAHDELRRGDVHQHSVASGQLAVENGGLVLNLQFPGANLVGFEHPPRAAGQHATLDAATERLRAGDWLRLPDAAGCSTGIEVRRPGFGVDAPSATRQGGSAFDAPSERIATAQGHADGHPHAHDEEHAHDEMGHDHDHGHVHEHDHDNEHHHDHDQEHGHAEFHVAVVADCLRPDALDSIELHLFEGWPDNRSVRIDAISPARQWQKELTPDDRGLDLR